MITEAALELIRNYVLTTFVRFNVGRGGDASSINGTGLDAPFHSSNQTSGMTITKSGVTSLDYTITLNGSTYVGETLKEVGIFDASGNMLIRVPFDAIGPFTSSQNIELVLTVEVI